MEALDLLTPSLVEDDQKASGDIKATGRVFHLEASPEPGPSASSPSWLLVAVPASRHR